MANDKYVKNNKLTIDADRPFKLSIIIGLPIVVLLIFVFPKAWFIFIGLFFVFAFIAYDAGNIKRAGATGEDVTLDILRGLPDSYTILNQVTVPNTKSRTGYTEYDVVIVGPNGVFVIEVKNNNSQIIGSEDSRNWIINKIGRRGTPYTKTVRNPIRQLKIQIWVLREFLKGYKTWIEGIVYFSNPDGHLEFDGTSSVKILQNDGLVEYIQSFKPKYPQRDTDNIIQKLAGITRG